MTLTKSELIEHLPNSLYPHDKFKCKYDFKLSNLDSIRNSHSKFDKYKDNVLFKIIIFISYNISVCRTPIDLENINFLLITSMGLIDKNINPVKKLIADVNRFKKYNYVSTLESHILQAFHIDNRSMQSYTNSRFCSFDDMVYNKTFQNWVNLYILDIY